MTHLQSAPRSTNRVAWLGPSGFFLPGLKALEAGAKYELTVGYRIAATHTETVPRAISAAAWTRSNSKGASAGASSRPPTARTYPE